MCSNLWVFYVQYITYIIIYDVCLKLTNILALKIYARHASIGIIRTKYTNL